MPGIEIVDQQHVDAVDAEALQAVLERAHHAVVAVVQDRLEFEAAAPFAARERPGLQRAAQRAADLAGNDELVARLAIERAADPMFGLALAVPGRGVEIADAAVPGCLQQRRASSSSMTSKSSPSGGGAKAELGHRYARAPELALR